MNSDTNPTTLYVGNLDHTVCEELLCLLFSQIGPVRGCRVVREPGKFPYSFIDFEKHSTAVTALTSMNKRFLLEKEMKVNWATSPGNQPKLDTSSHHHIFVGDLSPEIDIFNLQKAFAPFGEISSCRIAMDRKTKKSKGYAFISFNKKAEAENAILGMNGQWLGSRSIRTNWSTRKPPPPPKTKKPQIYEEVYNQTNPNNSTVYCGRFISDLNDDLILKVFSRYGIIQRIRICKNKGYGLITFTTKEAATQAIINSDNTEINGQVVNCAWAKETLEMNSPSSNSYNETPQMPGTTTPWPYMYGTNIGGYWYPQTYAAPTTQTQQQYMPNYQTAAYGSYAGYSPNFAARMPMPTTSSGAGSSNWYAGISSPPSSQGGTIGLPQQPAM